MAFFKHNVDLSKVCTIQEQDSEKNLAALQVADVQGYPKGNAAETSPLVSSPTFRTNKVREEYSSLGNFDQSNMTFNLQPSNVSF